MYWKDFMIVCFSGHLMHFAPVLQIHQEKFIQKNYYNIRFYIYIFLLYFHACFGQVRFLTDWKIFNGQNCLCLDPSKYLPINNKDIVVHQSIHYSFPLIKKIELVHVLQIYIFFRISFTDILFLSLSMNLLFQKALQFYLSLQIKEKNTRVYLTIAFLEIQYNKNIYII